MRQEVDLPEDDPDRIPEWLSTASGTNDAGSDAGWDMSLEDGSDDEEWVIRDD